jgi:hypothetical protein
LTHPLYRLHELAFRTQYGELKERVRAADELLPGTPGLSRPAQWQRSWLLVPGVLHGAAQGQRNAGGEGGR